jgi:endonuclease YncB( thermonuclease family)
MVTYLKYYCLVFIFCCTVVFAFEGKVVSIADGDTLTVLVTPSNQQVKVRLSGIDTPERKQAFGTQAKQALSAKVFGKLVRVQDNGQDRYGRTLGDIYLGERWVNLEMVAEGYAWHYKAYSKDKRLADAEVGARKAKRGLWTDRDPVPPWEFRKGGGKSVTKSQSDSEKAITGYWLNTSSGSRHNSNCRYYEKTKRGKPCGEGDGKPCGICGG